MSQDSRYSLQRPLPADVLIGGNTVWSRYRQYPVFSLPWLRGRSLVFALVIAVAGLLSGFGVGLATRDYGAGLLSGAHMFGAFMLMATAGPGLATWVRYRRWRLPRERIGVVLAVLVGIVLSFFADFWASAHIERALEAAMQSPGTLPKPPDIAAGERALAITINVVALIVIYGLFGGGLALRAYFSEQRRWERNRHALEVADLREHKQQADLRLGLLQAQVEPHFLFNTLASVRALVRQDPAQAEATLDALVEHLRATIPKLRDGEAALHSTLGQQLDICASYLELMRLRMGGRLSYAVDAAPQLRGLQYPPLLLITLVENAIKHGIEPQPGAGRIEVAAGVRDDRLQVSVSDDGVGLKPGFGSGVGLSNVREQLAARFGDRAVLVLESPAGRGARATITLPLESS